MFNGQLNRVQVDPKLQSRVDVYNRLDGWGSQCNTVEEFKATIKPKLIANQSGLCAYCGLKLPGRNMQRHIDHIANKATYTTVIFNPDNLVCSCARCNSTCKGEFNTVINCSSSDYSKWEFNIVHPYFDNPADFFEYNYISPGRIRNKKGLSDANRRKALQTIKLFELNAEDVLTPRREKMFLDLFPKHIMDTILKISCYRKH